MLLIDDPYVSNFLLETIRSNNFKIVSTPIARKLIQDDALAWITESEAVAILKSKSEPLYSNSENALDWVEQNLKESTLAYQIKVLKDKFRFRELIKSIFPDFYFRQVPLEEIPNLSDKDLPYPFVIKPSVGFFSVGVFIVENKEDWQRVKNKLAPGKIESMFPETVLNTNQFLIEERIDGEEYAIDYYHNHKGEAIILNILHHLFSSDKDTSDRVYSTSQKIVETHQKKIKGFLNRIGMKLNLRNFPAHAEVRINKKGDIFPIEINPLRFGGWCTSGDLSGLALGLNSYEYFFQNKKPDWSSIFAGKEDKLFSIIVLDNNSGINVSDISSFDYLKFEDHLEKPIHTRKLDIQKYPVFGFIFTETSNQNEKELFDILKSDLKQFIRLK